MVIDIRYNYFYGGIEPLSRLFLEQINIFDSPIIKKSSKNDEVQKS